MQSLQDRTERVDALIQEHWPPLQGVALLAVGGYGREELFPFSDVDLLFVTRRRDLKEPLAPFLRTLWDSGLRISHSVHSPEECLELDDRNVELSVSLLDRRFLLGDRALFGILRDPSSERLAPALARLTRERHARYGRTIYHLEPNLKDAPGALRDLHVLRWLTRLGMGSASPEPDHALLYRLRASLHEILRRDGNSLTYAMQDACAAALGMPDAAALMCAYYSHARVINRACLRRVDEAESRRSPLFAALRDRSSRLSSAAFSVLGGRVYFRVPPRDSRQFAALFEFIARHGLALARDTEDRIAQFDSATLTWTELRSILSLPFAGIALRAMHDTGFLVKLFPALRGIQSLVVRDFYHRYTVDEHTLVAIETAIRLRTDPGRFGELARETSGYPLLLLALLFHDSGKGVPHGEHAEASVGIASGALTQLGAPSAESDTVLYLIRGHLEMSRLMLTRDLTDPATAAALAGFVQTAERLKLLTLLTCCDISAVNPEAFTPWRATLLWQLYAATARRLTEGLHTDIADAGMPARYALTHSPDERDEHLRMQAEGRLTRLDRVGDACRLTVVTSDRPFLFARIAGALAGFGMNILRAEAFRNESGFAIQTFTFADPMRTLELNPGELAILEKLVRDSVTGVRNVEDRLRGRPPARHAPVHPLLPRVAFDNRASPRATLFEIAAEDRPGLLFDLASRISAAGCNIEVVLVDTEGRRALDVFYVTRDGQPLDPDSAASLRDALLAASSGRSHEILRIPSA